MYSKKNFLSPKKMVLVLQISMVDCIPVNGGKRLDGLILTGHKQVVLKFNQGWIPLQLWKDYG